MCKCMQIYTDVAEFKTFVIMQLNEIRLQNSERLPLANTEEQNEE